MKGLGIDLVSVGRIKDAMENPLFIKRVFTPAEQERIGTRFERAAGIFAAKEAVVKALGTGFGKIGLHDVEIISGGEGQPLCVLYRAAQARFEELGGRALHISITHEQETAAAVAVIE